MKKIILLLTISLSIAAAAQVKIGDNVTTLSPSSLLELENTNKALLLTRVANTAAITNPVNGMLIYDISAQCLKSYEGGAWTGCLSSTNAGATVTNNCDQNGFAGDYKATVAFTATNTFSVTITNSSFATATIAFQNIDVVLSGNNSGITVTATAPASATLTAGQSQTITYTLSGTPAACGPITATWTKLSLNCTRTTNIQPNVNCTGAGWATGPTPNPAGTGGLQNGVIYNGTYSIPYTSGGCTLAAESYTANGITITAPSGAIPATGSRTYTISGTYTGSNGGSVSYITSGGCPIYLGPAASCAQIKTVNPSATDGVYFIDPDQAGTTFGGMQAQCDMTTDGGGWTLVTNITAPAGSMTYSENRTTFPLIGGGVGVNESGNSTYFGGASVALTSIFNVSTAVRWDYASSSSRFNYKCTNSSVINAFKLRVGINYTDLSTYFALSGNTITFSGVANWDNVDGSRPATSCCYGGCSTCCNAGWVGVANTSLWFYQGGNCSGGGSGIGGYYRLWFK
jgi:hypothetical protein